MSSSAQLVLLPWLLGWAPAEDRTTFAAGLHAGSCVGISWALREDLRSLDRRTLVLLAGASVPAAVAGALAADAVEERLGRPPQLAALLAGAGLVMWAVDARAERRAGGRPDAAAVPSSRRADDLGPLGGRGPAPASAERGKADGPGPVTSRPVRGRGGVTARRDSRRRAGTPSSSAGDTAGAPPVVGCRQAAWAGAAQVVALVPGVSRSGATLTALRASGVSRVEAERFSLLMSLPVTAGAAVLTLLRADRSRLLPLAAELVPGAVTAGVAGSIAVRRRAARPGTPLRGAAIYRLGLATAVVLRLRSRKDGQ